MASKFFGEFMGTMILILMGNGALANMFLKRSKAEGTGWLAITTGCAFAVMMPGVSRPASQVSFISRSGPPSCLMPCAAP